MEEFDGQLTAIPRANIEISSINMMKVYCQKWTNNCFPSILILKWKKTLKI